MSKSFKQNKSKSSNNTHCKTNLYTVEHEQTDEKYEQSLGNFEITTKPKERFYFFNLAVKNLM